VSSLFWFDIIRQPKVRNTYKRNTDLYFVAIPLLALMYFFAANMNGR
jgi:hypothetical protein